MPGEQTKETKGLSHMTATLPSHRKINLALTLAAIALAACSPIATPSAAPPTATSPPTNPTLPPQAGQALVNPAFATTIDPADDCETLDEEPTACVSEEHTDVAGVTVQRGVDVGAVTLIVSGQEPFEAANLKNLAMTLALDLDQQSSSGIQAWAGIGAELVLGGSPVSADVKPIYGADPEQIQIEALVNEGGELEVRITTEACFESSTLERFNFVGYLCSFTTCDRFPNENACSFP
jgi:hypothetical protein